MFLCIFVSVLVMLSFFDYISCALDVRDVAMDKNVCMC